MAHAWSADQALAAPPHGLRARPRARCRLRLEGDLPDRAPAFELLLHHAAVPPLLGTRHRVRTLRRGPAVGELPETDAVGAGSIPPRDKHQQRRRRHPRVPAARARSAHRGHRRRHRPELTAAWTEDVHVEPVRDRHRRRRWRLLRTVARRVPDSSTRRLSPVPDRTCRRGAFDEATFRPPLQGRLARRPRIRKPVHHGHGRRHRKLRAGAARVGKGARGQRHDRALDAAGRDPGRLHQRQHGRGRVEDPQAELAHQPRVLEARRRAGQPRGRAGDHQRRADHRRPWLSLHLDPAQPARRGHGRGDQGLGRAEAVHLQPRGAAR